MSRVCIGVDRMRVASSEEHKSSYFYKKPASRVACLSQVVEVC